MKGRVLISAAITLVVMATMAAGPALADSGRDKDKPFGYGHRPGWGFGDDSHIHTGPPGLADGSQGAGEGE